MRTTDEIYDALAAHVAQSSGAVVAEGGDMSLRLRAVAAELFSLEAQADFVARQSFPQSAMGTYLDHHAQLRGLERIGAQKATGQLRFYVTSAAAAALTVPQGTQCRTAAGTAFVTTEAGTIPAGGTACTVAAEAMSAGAGGNAPAETVTIPVLPPVGVQGVCNDAAFSGGCDAESDEALRARVLASYRRLPNGANVAYYENRVLSYPGVTAVDVMPKVRGAGTVDVVFTMGNGIPNAAQVAEVQAMLEAEREISVDLLVKAPSTTTIAVTATVYVESGYEFSEVSEAVRAEIQRFFNGGLLSKRLYRARLLTHIMGVEGVKNCVLSAPPADVPEVRGRLPIRGNVTINQGL